MLLTILLDEDNQRKRKKLEPSGGFYLCNGYNLTYLFLDLRGKIIEAQITEIQALYAQIKKADLTSVTEPSKCTMLPLPLPPTFRPPERFICEEGKFPFIGRLAFTSLLDNARDFIFPTKATPGETSSNHSHMMVYGNMGGGKSHMLMVLALQLCQEFANDTLRKRRLVVLPQASDLVTYGANYMRAALMLAFADDEESLSLLVQTSTMTGLNAFCDLHAGKLVFIIDQYESFENTGGEFVLLLLLLSFLSFPSFLPTLQAMKCGKSLNPLLGHATLLFSAHQPITRHQKQEIRNSCVIAIMTYMVALPQQNLLHGSSYLI